MDKIIETISTYQIPFEDLKHHLGIPSSVFLNAPDSEEIITALTTLVNGRSCLTPLIDLDGYDLQFRYARFSLRSEDGKYFFRVYPVDGQYDFQNVFNLDAREIELLYKGERLIKLLDLEKKGTPVECLVHLIPNTNAQVACPRYTIDIPNKIGGQEITQEMKETLLAGGKQTIVNKDNQAFDIQIDLASNNMLKLVENRDRLLLSAGAVGQSQEAIGMGSVLGNTSKTTKPSTSKSKSQGGHAGKNPVAGQTAAASQGQTSEKSHGPKR